MYSHISATKEDHFSVADRLHLTGVLEAWIIAAMHVSTYEIN